MSIQTDINSAVSEYVRVPAVVRNLANRCNEDLYNGPLYLDANGEPVSMFDPEYDHAFDFQRATGILSDWCDRNLPPALYYESESGCLSKSPPEPEEDEADVYWESAEYYEIDFREITKTLFGGELARYL